MKQHSSHLRNIGKKWRWSKPWTIRSHRSQLNAVDSRIFEMLDAKIPSSLKKNIQNSKFKNRISLAERKSQLDDFFVEDRLLSRSVNTAR